MSTDTNTTQPAPAGEQERVYVQIPKAGPGQGYRSPKNTADPFGQLIWRIAVVLLAVSLPVAPALIFSFILGRSNALQEGFAWLWGFMIVFIEAIAIPVAIAIVREALGLAGSDLADPQRTRQTSRGV